jgi:phytol kinase
VTVILVSVVYAVLFLIGEIAARRLRISTEITRTAIHALAGLFAVATAFLVTRDELILLSVLFTAGLAISKKLALLTSIHRVPRATWGELWFPIGVGVAAWLYLPGRVDFYTLAVLIMALCDPLANLLGSHFSGPKFMFGKSMLGSSTFFLASIALSLFFVSPIHAVTVAALATIVEAISPYGSDNLTIISAVAVALRFL